MDRDTPSIRMDIFFLALQIGATILIALRVDFAVRGGPRAEGDAPDLRCRWLFPLF